jgi:antitoxin CptB
MARSTKEHDLMDFPDFLPGGGREAGESARDQRIKKMRYRAWHLGIKETDLFLGRFADTYLDTLDDAQLDAFEDLMRVPPWDIYTWLAGKGDVPERFDTDVMALLKRFDVTSGQLRQV